MRQNAEQFLMLQDPKQAIEYAEMLKPLADRLDNLLVVMRTYPEKPRYPAHFFL